MLQSNSGCTFGPSQLSCLGSSVGRVLSLEYRVSWVRVPPEAAHFFYLGCAVLLALFVCLTLLASFFLPSHLSFKNMYKISTIHVYAFTCTCIGV